MIRCASQTMPIQKVVARTAVVAAQIHGLRRSDFGPGLTCAFAMGRINRFLASGAPLLRRIR
jgi:hypothetical protein